MSELEVEYRPVKELVPYARNPRTHSPDQIRQIVDSVHYYRWTNPILVDEDGGLVAGHGRVLAANQIYRDKGRIFTVGGDELPDGMVPVIVARGWTEAQKKAYVIADNKLALNAGWDEQLLRLNLVDLRELNFDLNMTGFDNMELGAIFRDDGAGLSKQQAAATLAERFMVAPFSVLNAREGWWQDRKRAWIALGIESELGRGENALGFSDTILEPDPTKRMAKLAGISPAGLTFGEFPNYDGKGKAGQSGTSIFDPVLCEIAYRWFSPPDGTVLDPFAGGSVRGIVASRLGRQYCGVDLRPEQAAANEEQAEDICDGFPRPEWVVGDALEAIPEGEVDFVFSCPPYGDLEVYSDDPRDLSAMDRESFRYAYWQIIKLAVDRLKDDRFACFVVGDYRDGAGFYAGFIGDTVAAFEAAGARLYNEAILVTAAGSLPIRAAKQFSTSRKLGKTHQNCLVFCKGDPRRATAACGKVEVSDDVLAPYEAEVEAADALLGTPA